MLAPRLLGEPKLGHEMCGWVTYHLGRVTTANVIGRSDGRGFKPHSLLTMAGIHSRPFLYLKLDKEAQLGKPKMAKRISGTKEWAASNVNCVSGCSHDCLYCYARANAVRYKQKTINTWPEMEIRHGAVHKGYGRRQGRIMFPTAHDITPDVVPYCKIVLDKLLAANNEVLIVSKPHEDVILELCSDLAIYKDQILFRFTIGAMSPAILSLWEPGAPDFWERYRALSHAHAAGFKTSVSMEPLLEPERLEEMIHAFDPVVSDAIWIGKMNKALMRVPVEKRTEEVKREIERITEWQTDDVVKKIYNGLKDHPKIKWKESYKEVVGLKLAEKAGEDA